VRQGARHLNKHPPRLRSLLSERGFGGVIVDASALVKRHEQKGIGMTRTATAPHLRALERANEVRRARARLKREIAEREINAAEIILNPPAEASSWPVVELLMSQRQWGMRKCQRLLVHSQIDERRTIGQLTDRQRSSLVTQLD